MNVEQLLSGKGHDVISVQPHRTLSEAIRTMAWKGQLRLTSRYAALHKRGLQANKICVAVARELAGFVWAIGMHAQREKEAT